MMAFGSGVIVGMWYKASEQITPYSPPTESVEARQAPGQSTPAQGQEPAVTFYSTLTSSQTPYAPLVGSAGASGSAKQGPTAVPTAAVAARETGPKKRAAGAADQPRQPVDVQATVAPGRASDGPFSVQAGSFRTAQQAERLQRSLARKGYQAQVQVFTTPDGKESWYRVRVGGFADRSAADRAAQRLTTQEKIPAIVASESR
jgi:cell division protein FtsN